MSPVEARTAEVQRDLVAALLARMDERGLSRSELARRLGCAPAYVTRILRGDANFTLASLVKLAAAVGGELRVEIEPGERRGEGPPPRRSGERLAAPSVEPPRAPSVPPSPALPKPRRDDASWRVW